MWVSKARAAKAYMYVSVVAGCLSFDSRALPFDAAHECIPQDLVVFANPGLTTILDLAGKVEIDDSNF
jgi:hypothetical protein